MGGIFQRLSSRPKRVTAPNHFTWEWGEEGEGKGLKDQAAEERAVRRNCPNGSLGLQNGQEREAQNRREF